MQTLSTIDALVLPLLKEGVPIILAWDGAKNIWLEAVISGPDCDDDPPFDQDEWLEYQVSEGLPGERTFAESFYTFEDAQKAFDEMCLGASKTAPPASGLFQPQPARVRSDG